MIVDGPRVVVVLVVHLHIPDIYFVYIHDVFGYKTILLH